MEQETQQTSKPVGLLSKLPTMADVRVLGPVEVASESGEPIDVGGARPRAVLALLAVRAPQVVTVDEIIEELWGDSDIADPEASLRVTVSRLRSATDEGLIETLASGYRLAIPTTQLDLDRFRRFAARGRQLNMLGHPGKAAESYRQALGEWRGSALSDVVQFHFADRAAENLAEERLTVMEALVECEINTGGHDLVIGDLSGLVDQFPFREKLWELLMVALYRGGRQAEALRAYARYRDTIADELGLQPSVDLSDLEERILLHDPALTDSGEDSVEAWPVEPELETFVAGDVIVREGDPADTVYWIETGRVEVGRFEAGSGWVTLTELGPGRYFGELASLLKTTRTASVRALTTVTVSIHNATTFRKRMGVSQSSPDGSESVANEELRELLRRGQYLHAYDAASTLVDQGNTDPEVRFLATLALARSGATAQARRRFDLYGLATIDPTSVAPQLAQDIPALAARLDKDMALMSSGEERVRWARRSAEAYEAAAGPDRAAYPAINAAFMRLVAGDTEHAATMAEGALRGSTATDDYWSAAIVAEANLIGGNTDAAAEALEIADGLSADNHAARATTSKQLARICAIKQIDPAVLAPIRNPSVVHYCGHLILPPGSEGRFEASEESRVRQELVEAFDRFDVGFGYGSLAAGADILAAEALLARGAELNVVLPFEREDFIRSSVLPAGDDWVERFDRCLASADSVSVAMNGAYLGDPVLFDFCSRIAMGDAILRAEYLGSESHQVAVWDGVETGGAAGTAVDVAHWAGTDFGTEVIGVASGESNAGAAPDGARQVRAIVFGDFAGFSRLSDRQAMIFQEQVMGMIAEVLDAQELLLRRTWGDGVYLVFDDVAHAAETALRLQEVVRGMDFDSMGLTPLRGLRIAAHATPVFEGWDPISNTPLFYGAGVTTTARIEPRVPEGEVYTSRAFASLATLGRQDGFSCQYVGNIPTAKGYGSMPLFALRRVSDQ